ncbi:MAG TPA: DUF3592 domain-containing protein [Burkholderiaceae bacterium]|nr:DUF3592 domain-containing protein [Burkholderiaceae bacterium]
MKMSILWLGWIAAGLIFIGLLWWLLAAENAELELKRSGEEAAGVIASVSATGATGANSPVVKFRIRVQRVGQAEYEVEVSKAVPPIHSPAVQPGATLKVWVDRKNPQRIAVSWPWERT